MSERTKQHKMSKIIMGIILILFFIFKGPFFRQATSPIKYYDNSFRRDSIMSNRIVCLQYVAQDDKQRNGVDHQE